MIKVSVVICAIIVSMQMSSCSVVMAANKKGTSSEELSACTTRACILSKDVKPVESKKNKKGVVIEETYEVEKPQGSAARAAMHGVLDVATLGIWEVAGTPIEGTLNDNKKYLVKVNYDVSGKITSIQLLK